MTGQIPRFATFLLLLASGACYAAPTAYAQAGHPEIISAAQAHRFGLTRSWITRVAMDANRARIKELTLHEGMLLSVTDHGTVQAFDAETGRTLWVTNIGRHDASNTPVGASPKYVAMCNGSTLYVLSRDDGKLIFSRRMQGIASAAPAVSDERVYVPTFAGAIESYGTNLEKPELRPTIYRSRGTIEEAPVLAGPNLIWATHAGAVYSAAKSDLTARFRFMTRGEITAGLGYWPPTVFAASADGYIYAIDERKGKRLWQFSTGYPCREAPVPLDGVLYAISESSGMFCLSADAGKSLWFTNGIAQFVSASSTRLYCADDVGRMIILDRRSGAHLDTIPTERLPIKVQNIQTDRIYLASATGIVQCLREVQQTNPLVHALPPDPDTPAPVKTAPAQRAEAAPAEEAPAMEENADDPFGAETEP